MCHFVLEHFSPNHETDNNTNPTRFLPIPVQENNKSL